MSHRSIVKRNLRKFQRSGMKLEVIAKVPSTVAASGLATIRSIWAELEGEPVRKSPAYREGVEYIAMNDEPSIIDPELMEGYPTVHLLALLFGKDHRKVAEDVIAFRRKELAR